MPIITIIVVSAGAEVGVALLGETLGPMLAGAIGAGVGSGIVAEAQGGSFGKGFLAGAAGYGIGQGIKGIIGKGLGGTGASIGDSLAQDTMLTEQLSGFTNIGDITGELGWGNDIGSVGSAGFGESYFTPDEQYTSVDSVNPSIVGNDNPLVETYGLPSTEASFAGSLPGNQLGPLDVSNDTSGWSDIGMPQGLPMHDPMYDYAVNGDMPTYMTSLDNMNSSSHVDMTPGVVQSDGVPLMGQVTNSASTIPSPTSPSVNGDLSSTIAKLDNTNLYPEQTGEATWGVSKASPPVQTNTTGFMDKMGKMVKDSDTYLNKTFGLPKGSTALGALGLGSYLFGEYQNYKAEQIAKGMKPMTLEEYKAANNIDPNKWKVAANDMAKSGRTGTLPVLTARMNQTIGSNYLNNYLPNANNNWWNVNAKIAQNKSNNLGNLAMPFAWSLAMNKGTK